MEHIYRVYLTPSVVQQTNMIAKPKVLRYRFQVYLSNMTNKIISINYLHFLQEFTQIRKITITTCVIVVIAISK